MRNATAIAASDDRVVVLDALANEAVVVELTSGRASRIQTAETPIAAAFVHRQLYILARDARVLQHGAARISLSADPAFLRTSGDNLYVYSRTSGTLEEIRGDRVNPARQGSGIRLRPRDPQPTSPTSSTRVVRASAPSIS